MGSEIINVSLLPSWDAPDMRRRLAQVLKSVRALRSAVAYWTVGADFVGPHLCNRLQQPNGYLCVDVHLPTDIVGRSRSSR